MTEKLYYIDSHMKAFTATVTSRRFSPRAAASSATAE